MDTVNDHRYRPLIQIPRDAASPGDVAHEPTARSTGRVAFRAVGLMSALGFLGLMLTGCGADRSDMLDGLAPRGAAPQGGSAVNGVLDEWDVRADVGTVHAGPVNFSFGNTGTIVHEMLVTRTDILPGQIPVDAATAKFNEDDPTSKVIGEISEFDAGKTGTVTLDLTPGNYQLVCNVPGHYTKGMSMRFTVTP